MEKHEFGENGGEWLLIERYGETVDTVKPIKSCSTQERRIIIITNLLTKTILSNGRMSQINYKTVNLRNR